MPCAVHLLNKPDETGRPRLLTTVVKGISFKTCCWKLSAKDVASLVGGWVYLHDKKSEPARMGGVVTAVEPTEETGYVDQGRFAITFTSRGEARNMPWRGKAHGMAWTGGLVLADAAHEQ